MKSRLFQSIFIGIFFSWMAAGASEDVLWGPVTDGVQLSLAAHPAFVKNAHQLVLHFRARNLTKKRVRMDALVPFVNQSSIVVTDPEGEVRKLGAKHDQLYRLELPSGETDLGSIGGEASKTNLENYWQPAKRLKGEHRIVWTLGNAESNFVAVMFN